MSDPDGADPEPDGDRLRGPCGEAHRVPYEGHVGAEQTVGYWLVTAPGFHPAWSQYAIACIRLDDDAPGFAKPHHRFLDTTHELLVLAMDPTDGPHTPESVLRPDGFKVLRPVNIAHQFIATDEEMRELTKLAAKAVVRGWMNPETADAPERIREDWLTALTRTLAHIRGEAHAHGRGVPG